MSLINRLLGSLRKNSLEDWLDHELRFHIKMPFRRRLFLPYVRGLACLRAGFTASTGS